MQKQHQPSPQCYIPTQDRSDCAGKGPQCSFGSSLCLCQHGREQPADTSEHIKNAFLSARIPGSAAEPPGPGERGALHPWDSPANSSLASALFVTIVTSDNFASLDKNPREG